MARQSQRLSIKTIKQERTHCDFFVTRCIVFLPRRIVHFVLGFLDIFVSAIWIAEIKLQIFLAPPPPFMEFLGKKVEQKNEQGVHFLCVVYPTRAVLQQLLHSWW